MKRLIELSSEKHKHLRVTDGCALRFAAAQHVMHVRASEVSKAVSSFPVLIGRGETSGAWSLSAVSSLEAGRNLFVENDVWQALYEPLSMQTYPLFLMQSPNDANEYTLGIDESSDAFSEQQGEPLFDESGSESLYLDRLKAMLKASAEADMQTHYFAHRFNELDLFKSINLVVQYEDGGVQTIVGLHTIDEDRLQSLSAEELEELNKKGYLMLAHSMLVSLFRLNELIRRHNRIGGAKPVKQVKMEIARSLADSAQG